MLTVRVTCTNLKEARQLVGWSLQEPAARSGVNWLTIRKYEGAGVCSTIHKPLFMHPKTYDALLRRLRQIEAKPDSRTYKSNHLTERTLNPSSMYQVEVASIANV
jgi:hypothetical protein